MKNTQSITKHQIGKITYVVCSSASEQATDTIDKKIKRLIVKDIGQSAEIFEKGIEKAT